MILRLTVVKLYCFYFAGIFLISLATFLVSWCLLFSKSKGILAAPPVFFMLFGSFRQLQLFLFFGLYHLLGLVCFLAGFPFGFLFASSNLTRLQPYLPDFLLLVVLPFCLTCIESNYSSHVLFNQKSRCRLSYLFENTHCFQFCDLELQWL